jgi:DNA-binding winged helix-turn-helix (wHTH) protein
MQRRNTYMPDPYPEHPVNYRQETTGPLFNLLQQGESCVVVGAASMAKSNLVRFLLRPDVQEHYLGTGAQRTLMVLVDTNRITEFSEWAGYELFLDCLATQSHRLRRSRRVAQSLSDLHREVTLSRDRLLGQRYVERAAWLLCSRQQLRLVILLDEADAFYRTMDAQFLSSLRALRDEHKYQLCYTLLTRRPLDLLRDPTECEAFYELFTRNVLGLKPYREIDAQRIISQLEARKQHELTDSERKGLMDMSGGHPGMLLAVFDALARKDAGSVIDADEQLLRIAGVRAECQKLWDSLDADEQWALSCAEAGLAGQDATPAHKLLILKGLIVQSPEDKWRVFSSLLGSFIAQTGEQVRDEFRVDENTASVWAAGKQVTNLTRLEFELAKLFYDHPGQVLTRDDILIHLYPDEFRDAENSRIDTLVRRLRAKVEPFPGQPRYILTVRGHGYKLRPPPDCE